MTLDVCDCLPVRLFPLYGVSTPADVLVLDPVAHPAGMGARITSVCPSVRPSARIREAGAYVRVTCVHRQSLTFHDLLTILTAHALYPYLCRLTGVLVSPLSRADTYARACCAVHLLVAVARHAARRRRCERASAPGAVAINTN